MKGFDIVIKDNFLDKDIFEKIHQKINTYNYLAGNNKIEGIDHIWFSCHTEEEIKKLVKNKCEEVLNKKFKVSFCCYTMLATVEPRVHCDLNESCDYQIIIYIKGNPNLHKGTGFYLNNELNTHIGFNENRAVIWHSNTFHSPLNWASDDQSKRYSIICQLKEL
jgi:hypothetical protein|tara:strand:+ start:505 stop:996 length:492 start_codon:yes stop_codon:yes gene_type:complete